MFTLITNARVYAPEDLGHRHLLIVGGRIAWMGADLDALGMLKVGRVVDLEGRRLLPGLIDGHAHLTGGGGEAGFGSRIPPVPVEMFFRAGVTTAVGVLGTDDTTRDTRSLIAQTLCVRDHGLSAWCHTGGYHLPPVTFTGSVRDDIVFLEPVIGVGEVALSDHRSSQPTLQELLRVASDAYVAGMLTGKAGILHLHMGDGARGLELVREALASSELPARVFNPTHINRKATLFEEAIELARGGSTVDITAYPLDNEDKGLSAGTALLRYLDGGAPADRITLSSDGGGCLPVFDAQGEMQHWEVGDPGALTATLTQLLADGVPLERILPAFTLNVAKLLRLHDKGRIAEGAAADLVVLDEHHRVRDVMTQGVWRIQA